MLNNEINISKFKEVKSLGSDKINITDYLIVTLNEDYDQTSVDSLILIPKNNDIYKKHRRHIIHLDIEYKDGCIKHLGIIPENKKVNDKYKDYVCYNIYKLDSYNTNKEPIKYLNIVVSVVINKEKHFKYMQIELLKDIGYANKEGSFT